MTSTLTSLHNRILVKQVDQYGNLQPVSALENNSIRPVPVRDRTWTQLTYALFWFSATSNVSNLYAASTGMTEGLTMWEAIVCSLSGQFLAGFLIAVNGRAGAIYRIPFPVLCRSSFGTWGAIWPTFNRACMSIVWNGVNSVQGAQCLYVCLHAIFPSIENIPDKMGTKSALTSAQMMCFFIYCNGKAYDYDRILNCAFLVIPVPKMKGLVYAKVAIFFSAVFGMIGWTVCLAGNPTSALNQPSTVSGSTKSWVICKFLFLGLASCGTFISNAADFQRYAKRPNNVILGQVIGFPLSNFIVAVCGNVIAAAGKGIFGELIWNPLTLLDKLMEGERYTHANRAGCALISLAFVYASISSAIFENSIPAGNDIASLLPKYITIKRGFFICAVLSYAICPWYLLSSAAVFINFLSSYQIFLSAIAGILICDYYLIRRGYLDIPLLYIGSQKENYYYYTYGFNIRAFVAYLVPVAIHFYGFLNQLGVSAPMGIQRFYYVAYPTGLLIAFGLYYLFCIWFPFSGMVDKALGWKEPQDYSDENHLGRITEEGIVSDGVDVVTQEANVEKGQDASEKRIF
ncbi:permease for cytosine/purines, uracil, thiamine, allantoin-domain-containing protein [Talaromyces proteolyticus]|uniref:Permease for cytosine/purines, uracil, thiamine, allantoin-domain-containing protein n=1 Tax=Talaromyces proteolyticus TaxID=1131652 RepID=A0AAD4KRH5_9EURO|nr:permease for cytosine/purines, uracil, thiamine, allantoin-domain-containing protein [Talaromyces proteolyticus]KAH8698810.1 permease for cytosine/purines, uracil, thiamine, allantoin-domain-containing protein [Talaromyces proteolyticus]